MREFLNSPLVLGVGGVGLLWPVWLVVWWLMARDLRRMRHRWAVDRQLRKMEQSIREERLPEDERERSQRYREEETEIRREARRRLGLPEEERTH